jgi:hypothetical protein
MSQGTKDLLAGAEGAYITQDPPGGPYVLKTDSGKSYSLSMNDAIRAQQAGIPYRAPGRPRI